MERRRHGTQLRIVGTYPGRTGLAGAVWQPSTVRKARGIRVSRDRLGPEESSFIAERDTFYMSSIGATGWPYVQHRGGPKGFLKVIDDRTIAFADFPWQQAIYQHWQPDHGQSGGSDLLVAGNARRTQGRLRLHQGVLRN